MKNPKQLLKYGLHAAVLLGIVWAGVKYIDGEQFAKALHQFDWRYAPFVAALGLASVLVKSWRFATLVRQVQQVPRALAMRVYVAGQSATLLPGGIAARSAMLEREGVKVEDSAPAVALSSICDQIGFIVCGLVAAAWFEQARKPVFILIGVLAAVSVVLGIEATRTWLVRLIEKILHRFKLLDKWRGFVDSMRKTLSWRILAMGVGNTLLSFALLVLALHLCLAGIGVSVHPLTLLLAFTLPTMLGRISALPGGFGVTEVGMVGILDQAPKVTLDQAAVAVMIFRAATIVFTAVAGGIVYAIGWKHQTEPAPESEPAKESAPEKKAPAVVS